MTLGEQMEARVAQLWFWEGFYSRQAVDLRRHFYPEPLHVTDLDLLAFDFNPQLIRSKYIGEVKTGKGKSADKPLDRVVWLRGLRELVEADAAELTIAQVPSGRVRELGRSLRVVAQSIQDFERRESETVGPLADFGSQGVAARQRTSLVRGICREDPMLDRAFGFLRSAVWFLDPFTAVKQIIDVLRRLKKMWTPQNDNYVLRWLLAESVSIFTLNLVTIAGFSLTFDRQRFFELVHERLAEGVVPGHQMRRLSESVDKYVAGMLRSANAPMELRAKAVGAFLPEPPEYAESLAEVAWRIGRMPLQARSLPRQVDLLLFERVGLWRDVPEIVVRRLGLERRDAIRLRTLVAGFLRGCGASVDVLDAGLLEAVIPPLTTNHQETSPSADSKLTVAQEQLFDEERKANE